MLINAYLRFYLEVMRLSCDIKYEGNITMNGPVELILLNYFCGMTSLWSLFLSVS